MKASDIARLRQCSQHIAGFRSEQPADIVHWMGAVQAQDYPAALWAVGLRAHKSTARSVEQAIAGRKIIRTWPMRGTLHFVAPSDVRWMLKYLSPRMVARAATRFRQLSLNESTFARSSTIIAKALEGGKQSTRDALFGLLRKNRISTVGQRGIHILWRLAHDGLICFGARDGKQPTFVLLDEWVPNAREIPRDEALTMLATRYFTSHGPATLKDFIWWSGLTTVDAQTSIDGIKSRLVSETFDGVTYWLSQNKPPTGNAPAAAYLLPAFDEYLVGYTDRSAAIDQRYAKRMHPGGGILRPTVVVDGRIVGTWNRTIRGDHVEIQVVPFSQLGGSQRRAVSAAAESYGAFLGKNVDIVIAA